MKQIHKARLEWVSVHPPQVSKPKHTLGNISNLDKRWRERKQMIDKHWDLVGFDFEGQNTGTNIT